MKSASRKWSYQERARLLDELIDVILDPTAGDIPARVREVAERIHNDPKEGDPRP